MNRSKNNIGSRGFTLVEAVIGTAVFLVIAMAAYQGYSTLLKGAQYLRVKSAATALANERVEIIRNMSFASVGTVGGVPAGNIPQVENVLRDGINFSISTVVRNIDDSFDGTATTTPADSAPSDYKLAEISVVCTSCAAANPIVFTARVSPLNLESSSNNGSLFVKVFDANGAPVSGATVNVINSSSSPEINLIDTSDTSGTLAIVDTATGTEAYRIVVTKDGYSTDETHSASLLNPHPVKPAATVAKSQVTQTSFVIDRVGSISFSTVDRSCAAIGSVGVDITGAKLIGTDPDVYKTLKSFSTGAGGTFSLNNLEWDTYSLDLNSSSYVFAGSNVLWPLVLNPGENKNVRISLAPAAGQSLFLSVSDSANGEPINNAEIILTGNSTSTVVYTGQEYASSTPPCLDPGQVFVTGLPIGEYSVSVSAPGYDTYNDNISVSNSWQSKKISL